MLQSIQKNEKLTEAVFDLLASNIHKTSDFHFTFSKRAIANSLYDMSDCLRSGLISTKALDKLESKEYKRKDLCKEHPYPRTRTAHDIFKVFDSSFMKVSNTELKQEIRKCIDNGSKVHYVLTEENQRLYPFQQDYSLTEEEIYFKAGVELVEDKKIDFYPYSYYYLENKYSSVPEMITLLNKSKYSIEKMIKCGDIEKRANK